MIKNLTISGRQVEHVAKLANLEVTVQETQKYGRQLSEIISFVKKINNVRVSVLKKENVSEQVLRADEPNSGNRLSQEDATKNGKKIHNGLFVVPPVFEEI